MTSVYSVVSHTVEDRLWMETLNKKRTEMSPFTLKDIF